MSFLGTMTWSSRPVGYITKVQPCTQVKDFASRSVVKTRFLNLTLHSSAIIRDQVVIVASPARRRRSVFSRLNSWCFWRRCRNRFFVSCRSFCPLLCFCWILLATAGAATEAFSSTGAVVLGCFGAATELSACMLGEAETLCC